MQHSSRGGGGQGRIFFSYCKFSCSGRDRAKRGKKLDIWGGGTCPAVLRPQLAWQERQGREMGSWSADWREGQWWPHRTARPLTPPGPVCGAVVSLDEGLGMLTAAACSLCCLLFLTPRGGKSKQRFSLKFPESLAAARRESPLPLELGTPVVFSSDA